MQLTIKLWSKRSSQTVMPSTSPHTLFLLLSLLLPLHTYSLLTCRTGYTGGSINRVPFWLPNKNPHTAAWNLTEIPHTKIPFTTTTGYEVNAGHIGMNEFAQPETLRAIDHAAVPWSAGTVDEVWGLPNSTTNGYTLRTKNFYTNFNNGLSSNEFVVLQQKGSLLDNIDIVMDKVNGIDKNVLRMQMHAYGTGDDWHVASGGILQTREFFSSGR